MMPRSIILWRKLVRVIVALEADLSVIALGPSMCFFYLQISGLLGEATATGYTRYVIFPGPRGPRPSHSDSRCRYRAD